MAAKKKRKTISKRAYKKLVDPSHDIFFSDFVGKLESRGARTQLEAFMGQVERKLACMMENAQRGGLPPWVQQTQLDLLRLTLLEIRQLATDQLSVLRS